MVCTAILVHASGAWAATADSYPGKPIRIIDGFPAGGGTDYAVRVIAPRLTERLGQTVVIDNRPGASSNIGAEIAAHASPDGYTLFVGSSTTLATSYTFFPKLGYDLLKDFSYVSRVAIGPYVLVAHPSLPVKSVAELVALARSQPGTIRYGSGGVGNSNHLIMELLQSRAGIELLHVPYKGGAPFAIGLTGGEVQIGFPSVAAAIPMINAKRLNALAIASGKRIGVLPDVPTVAESGFPGFDVATTYGIFAPRGTPAGVVTRLNAEIRNIVQMEDIKARFAEQGMEAAGSTPEEWRAMVEAETAQWARVIKSAHITVN